MGKVYSSYFDGVNVSQMVQWFELGGSLKLDETVDFGRDGQAARPTSRA